MTVSHICAHCSMRSFRLMLTGRQRWETVQCNRPYSAVIDVAIS